MSIEDVIKKLNRNRKLYGDPDAVDYNKIVTNSDKRFLFTNDNVEEDIKNYFINDPDVWHFPAKNIFVRICLSVYIVDTFSLPFNSVISDSRILPYEDKFINNDFDIINFFNKIDLSIDYIKQSYGYKKTLEVFGYLYK